MKWIFSLLIVTLFAARSFAQNFAEVEQLMLNNQRTLGDEQALVIYKDNKILFQKTLGAFKANMQAPIGESSQLLTAALVLMMAEEGKISLDDKIGKYLPVFPKWMKGYITIRQCLSHTTGIEADKAGAAKIFQKKLTKRKNL